MNVTQKIKMDLLAKQNIQTIHAVRDDTNSRLIEISLFEGGIPWAVPVNSNIAIAYLSANGANGIYDTLTSGEVAYSFEENKITIVLVPASLYPGTTSITVVISDETGSQISTFPLKVEVDENYSYGASEPENYINLRQWMSAELVTLLEEMGAIGTVWVKVTQQGINGIAADKGYAELYAAYVAGHSLCCQLPDGAVLALVSADETGVVFQGEVNREYQLVSILADGTVSYKSGKYALVGEVAKTYTVLVFPGGDGYTTEDGIDDILAACESSATVVCDVELDGEQANLRLPLVKYNATAAYFGAVFDGKEYMVTITADGVTVEISECGGGNSGGNVDLTGYATEQYVQEYAQPKGNYLTEVPEGYAKTEDVPKNASDIGAQPEGDYALRSEIPSVPVKSVNGKTGAVSLAAADVKARPDNWMPTASDVGALPSSTVIPTVPTKVSEFANDAGYLTEHQDISGLAAKFDPTVYGLPVLELTGDTSPIAVSKDNKVTLTYVYGERSGTCTLKGQGATSYKTAKALVDAGKAGKFNYTIKFDNAFEAKEGWGAQQKYCLKANFIDTTHSRNIVSCKLWGMSVKARSAVPSQLANLPNGGAIDGFPIIIMLNGEFHGLYTWNIPKDGWMFGLVEDTTKTQALVGANDHELATQFKGELAGDESDFELEFVSNENSTAWVSESLNRLINACIDSDGSDLDSTVAQYVDWDSAIDYFVHCVVDKATDCVDKNFLLVTFDGVKWYFSAYDRDSIHGLNWDASGTTRPVSNISFAECKETSRMWELIYRFKTDALKARYWELRENILSESRIMQTFENFAWNIPSPVLVEDVKRYPTILGSSVNTIDQIGRFVRQRLDVCDAWVNALPAQESTGGGSAATTYAVTNNLSNCVSSNSGSSVNADSAYNATITANDGYTLDGASVSITMGGTDITSAAYSNGVISIASVTGAVVVAIAAVKKASGYTNLVPASTDADGNIYNDTGYMDDVRLSSSGTVSSTAQAGSATTGFMPYSDLGIIRVKGATWLDTTGHYYVAFYDSDKALLYAVSRSGYDDGNVRGAVITYDDATGVTTFDFSGTSDTSEVGDAIRKAVYFRLNAYGKGADLIVTVNEEIT